MTARANARIPYAVTAVAGVRRDLPDAPITALSIKPGLTRIDPLPRQREGNALIAADAKRLRDVDCIDVARPMLGIDGCPPPELSLDDGLQMTPSGYALWRGSCRRRCGGMPGRPGRSRQCRRCRDGCNGKGDGPVQS